jgi:hypothetical protein
MAPTRSDGARGVRGDGWVAGIWPQPDAPLAVRRKTAAVAPGTDAPMPSFTWSASAMSLSVEITWWSSKPGSFLSVVAVGFARASKEVGKLGIRSPRSPGTAGR